MSKLILKLILISLIARFVIRLITILFAFIRFCDPAYRGSSRFVETAKETAKVC